MNYSKKILTTVSPEVKMTKSIGKEGLRERVFLSHRSSNTGTHALGRQLRTKDAFNQEAIL